MNAEDFVPGLYPLKVGAIVHINRALGIVAHKPQQAPQVKEYAPDSENRAGGQSGAADAIVAPSPLPQIEIDPSPLTDDEIAYGQRIANDPAIWDAPGVPLETVLAKHATTANDRPLPQIEAETSVIAYGVGDAESVGESVHPQKRKSSASNRSAKRNPKAVQQVIDYLMLNPRDIELTVAQLTDKLKYDVRIKVGHSSVGKALGIMKTDGKEKAS